MPLSGYCGSSPAASFGTPSSSITSFQVWQLVLAFLALADLGGEIGEQSSGFEKTSISSGTGAPQSHFGAPASSDLSGSETRNFSGQLQELENQTVLAEEIGNCFSTCHYKVSDFYSLITAETFVKNYLIDGFFVTCLHWWLEAANKSTA